MSNDRVYATPRTHIVDFQFDETVARVFPDMIRRSVPGYGDIIALTGLIAGRYAQGSSNCYDLGCSLGATTLAMRRRIHADACRIVAVDNSEAMLRRCKETVVADGEGIAIETVCGDIRDVPIHDASVVALNFTLQFIPPEDRLALLRRIRAGMRPGGVLVLSEKIAFTDPVTQVLQEQLHLDFKRANGYSELEISQKRTALENVLIPETLEHHRARLAAAGYSRSELWFQCFNFASLVAFA